MSVGRRALAWCVDFGLMIAVAGLLGALTYQRMLSPLSGAKASFGLWELFSSGSGIAGVAGDTGAALWRVVVALVVQAFAALVLVQFLYQFLALVWTGRTLGKVLVDIRVVPAVPVGAPDLRRGLPRGRALRRAAVTTVADTGLFALACCLLVAGEVVLSVLCWLIAVLGFWVNVLPVLGRRRRTLADVCAGTVVSPGGMLRAVAQGVAQGGQVAAERLAHGRRVAVQGGRQAVQSARGLANHERVRQALESEPAQQVRDAGHQAAQQVRDAGHQAAQQVREAGHQAAQQVCEAGQQAAARGLQAWQRLRQRDRDSQTPPGP